MKKVFRVCFVSETRVLTDDSSFSVMGESRFEAVDDFTLEATSLGDFDSKKEAELAITSIDLMSHDVMVLEMWVPDKNKE